MGGSNRQPTEGNKKFWGRYARVYDFEINRFNKAAYQRMYQMMAAALTPDMEVLELATGTGLIGFETYAKWTPEEYVAFIASNGFAVDSWQVLQAAFPLVYLEAHAL
jgi:ubiquinone/menaquinone biosynthesis C-methylase UbiE